MNANPGRIAILAVVLAAGCGFAGCAGENKEQAREPDDSHKKVADAKRPSERITERPVEPALPDEAAPPKTVARPQPTERPKPPFTVRPMVPFTGPKTMTVPPDAARLPKAAVPDSTPRSVEPAERPVRIEPGARESGAEPEAETEEAAETQDAGFTRVKVYYGTDRAPNETAGPNRLASLPWRSWLIVSATVTILLASLACFFRQSRALKGLATVGLAATVLLGATSAWSRASGKPDGLAPDEFYGNQRGEVQFGTCEVSIPEQHEVGELEGPSLLRLEFHENPERHVVLLNVAPQSPDEFFDDCRQCVARSKSQQALVFIHGYNVSFEDAARRTAQLAHDLQFDGAPIFYSWPSQAGLLQYSVDETNATWTVPHLKEFLLEVARRSGAKSVHLIAHSMGNRALASALYNLSHELGDEARIFREVVLTAPDIDADVFRRDIAPAIVKTADRVTLYASSKDEALALSKSFHGYPRAGDSGSDLVVVPGIDTIDVSDVETSLLGHSYYGSNDTVLADLAQLLLEAKPARQRPWLQPMPAGPLRYWVLLRERIDTASGPGAWR